MKKILAVLLVGLLVLTGCGSKDKDKEPAATTGQDVKIGSAVISTGKTTEAGEKDGSFETNIYYATVVMKDDKFVNVQIDVNQNKQTFKADGTINAADIKGSKKVLGKDYGMVKNSQIKKEWFEQIAALEEWMVGKTLAEVKGIKTEAKDDAHPAVPTEANLTSSVTISVEKYIEVVEKAVGNLVEVKNVAKVGNSSTAVTGKEGLELTTNVTAVALDTEGKVVYSFTDAAQSKGKIEAGKAEFTTKPLTKLELKEEYGMKEFGKATLEWYEQAKAFDEWAIGKKPADLKDADVVSSVTITPTGLVNGVKAAAERAVGI